MSQVKLKSCPFCGAAPRFTITNGDGIIGADVTGVYYGLGCPTADCPACEVPFHKPMDIDKLKSDIDRWNRRGK